MTVSQSAKMASFFVTCPKGVETLLAEEIAALGGEIVKTTVAGVHLNASLDVAYRVCLWSRLANRVILRLVQEEGVEAPKICMGPPEKSTGRAMSCPG
ncbi:hypothetical protein [Modicisalibacter luteus]|uniref:hypothetical protein n=1 Tax=Modicisalibacter luteus TaxID=453962 RepID=UPI00364474D7